MSSYKGHTLFALILVMLFTYNPLVVFLALIGANISDFDHKIKSENVYRLIILGLVVFIILYILKLPYFIGLILLFLGVIFYFSNHRGFTHSFFGLMILTVLISALVYGAHDLFANKFTYVVIVFLLAFLFFNRRLFLIFTVGLFLSLLTFGVAELTIIQISSSLFLGIFSHMVLDSFTPAGVKLFAPLSSKDFHRKFGFISVILIFLMVILFNLVYLSSVLNYNNGIQFIFY